MSIIVSKNGKGAQKIDKMDVQKESYLQEYIHNNPESIPVYELDADKRLFVAKREFPTNAGLIDALAFDQHGEIYIVETKLYKNPDKRTVIAQALDYGAALWRHMNDFTDFIRVLDQESQRKFNTTFEHKLRDFFSLDDLSTQNFLDTVKHNLDDGKIKFLILMNQIDERMRDLILYVNQNSQFDVYAVQLEYYKFEDYEIVIPKMFGMEVKKSLDTSFSGARKKWNERLFFEDVKKRIKNSQHLEAISKVYDFCKEEADDISWGTGNDRGSFIPRFYDIAERSVFGLFSDGNLAIFFHYMNNDERGMEQRRYFLDKLRELKGIEITDDSFRTYAEIPVEKWAPVADDFIKTIEDPNLLYHGSISVS